tara:strand:- start:3259 stop:3405 length:147 start_codon:yes stop_codon:yes gene_type:complete
MTLIKEHKRINQEIFRLTHELEQAQELISMYRETLKQVNRSYDELKTK